MPRPKDNGYDTGFGDALIRCYNQLQIAAEAWRWNDPRALALRNEAEKIRGYFESTQVRKRH